MSALRREFILQCWSRATGRCWRADQAGFCVLAVLTMAGCAPVRDTMHETLVLPQRVEMAAEDAADEPKAVSNLQAIGEREVVSADGRFRVRYRTLPDPIPMNDLFTLHVQVVEVDTGRPIEPGTRLEVDARMPHHRHGMVTSPIVTPVGDGSYEVEGMLFHMPGRWELHLDIVHGRTTERAQDVIFID